MSLVPTTAPPNLLRLHAFVRGCIDRSDRRAHADAIVGLRRDAARIEHQLRTLAAWADRDIETDAPVHLRGLSAFDLCDAMDALQAEAVRRGSGVPGTAPRGPA